MDLGGASIYMYVYAYAYVCTHIYIYVYTYILYPASDLPKFNVGIL